MTTIREQILATLVETLQDTPSIGAPVYRSRVTPLARGESPAIILEPVNDQADQMVVPKIDWKLLIRISVIVRSEIPDQAADTLVQNVHKRVMSDLTVNGYAYDIQTQQTSFELLESDVPSGVISTDYIVLYRTSLADLNLV